MDHDSRTRFSYVPNQSIFAGFGPQYRNARRFASHICYLSPRLGYSVRFLRNTEFRGSG